jgi:hypothetical protein
LGLSENMAPLNITIHIISHQMDHHWAAQEMGRLTAQHCACALRSFDAKEGLQGKEMWWVTEMGLSCYHSVEKCWIYLWELLSKVS